MGDRHQADSRSGLAYGLAAYGLWGLMPLYFAAVAGVQPIELVAHRVVWSVLLLLVLLTVSRRWAGLLACVAVPRNRWLLLASTLLIASNWFIFIYGVATRQVVQNSLGFFINPLLNVLLGVLFFHEKLRRMQWLTLALAGAGLAYLIAAQGELPWIAFSLAGTFALYGLLRKVAPVEALAGLTIETLFLLPVAAPFLVWWSGRPDASFGRVSGSMDAPLIASGAVTAVPLLCFGQAARRLRLSTLGFLQYLTPTLQFLVAVLVLGEPFRPAQQVSFGLIWLALLLAGVDSVLAGRRTAAGAAPRCDRALHDQPASLPGCSGSARHSGQAPAA